MKLLHQPTLAAIAILTAMTATAQSPVAVRWEMGRNEAEPGFYSSRFVIKNVSPDTLPAQRWQFFFNQFSRRVTVPAVAKANVEEISTTYYRVTPNANYQPLAPNDTIVVDMMMNGTLQSMSYVPMGGHVVIDGDLSKPIAAPIEYAELSRRDQTFARGEYPDGNAVFARNDALLCQGCGGKECRKNDNNTFDIFPTPKSVELSDGYATISGMITISAKGMGKDMKKAKNLLVSEMRQRGIYAASGQKTRITLKIDKKAHDNAEYYRLSVRPDTIVITGASGEGLMNGIKTLLATLDHSKANRINCATVTDYPDFHYRGFMLDIARNFTNFNNLKRTIDLLASYKINRFQFHFTDDEAWRVEIPGIPELTEITSRRGCTLDEKEFLAQIYDGNGNPDDLTQSANGYLTRAQFVELVKYADSRGVKVIPEIETPGHSRAIIVAMRNRYNRYIATDAAKANQFRVWDLNDKTDATSVQAYKNNVLNLAEEGTYNFLQTVIIELEKMYKEAGVKLDVIHLGGDEVATGAWDNSPSVIALKQAKGYTSEHEVSEYYMRRITDFLYPRGIRVEGWQEVALDHNDAYNAEMAKRFAGVNAWSTLGKRDVVPYTVANSGYPTILSNVTNFYIDMGYSWNQYEQGLHWGGCVDEFAAWDAQPWNIYRSARTDYNGQPADLEHAADGKVKLERPECVIGVQGQLWAETLRNYEQVQKLMLPKMMGLVERGWNSVPEWERSGKIYEECRREYNAKIGTVELPTLKRRGYAFHIGQPGIIVKDGMLIANTQYRDEIVHYTLDGSDPDALSPVWTEPVKVPEGTKLVKARAFYLGTKSVPTYLWLDE